LLATAPPLDASFTSSVGGDNGQPFTISCDADEVMVGIRGGAGSYIDRVQPLCARWRAGGWMNEPRRGAWRAGSGGTPYRFQCPPGQAVAGLKGGAGDFVDRLQVICAYLKSNGSVDSMGDEAGQPVGGIYGRPYSIECPAPDPGRGLTGARGSWINR